MKLGDQYQRYALPEAQKSLANKFGLYWHESEQDWPLVVSETGWISQFLNAYKNDELSDDQKFALMELIVSSFDDLAKEEDLTNNIYWIECQKILKLECWLHITTIHYWSQLDCRIPDECFAITKYIRPIWEEVKSNFT